MVALLIALSVMSIMLAVALPVWRQASTREKEAELVFRGKQYARAIELFQRKTPGALPPNLDLLVDQKYLRKKYKDPITGGDFLLVRQGEGTTGAQPGRSSGGATTGRQTSPPQSGRGGASAQPGGVVGGIMGVSSKSTDSSILIYNGRTKYNEWQFVYVAQTQSPGTGGVPGTGEPGQRGRGGAGRQGGPGAPPFGPGPGQGGGRSQPPGAGGGPGFEPPSGRQGAPPSPTTPRRP